MKAVAIVGAGITGLVAAYNLNRRGVPCEIFEASTHAGGVVRTVQRDGFLAECGPNTLLETAPEIPQLIEDLGLGTEALYSNPEASNKYVVRGRKLIPVPASPINFLTSPLFSTSAKLALLREPFVPPSNPEIEESLGQFVVRRLGHEFLDYAINPMVAGIYAGDPWKLSVREAFKKVYDLEQHYGSMIKGQIFGARERKKRGAVSKQNAPKRSFLNGLQTLPSKLAGRLEDSIRYGCSLRNVRPAAGGWRLSFESRYGVAESDFESVIFALPAHQLAQIPISGHKLEFLSQIVYAPISSLVLGFKRGQVSHPLDGFGFLVPEVENMNILGAIFNSSLFPNRAPEGHVTITCYLGGLRAPELPFLDAATQIKLALADLRSVLGVTGDPAFTHQTVHARGIPQYDLGYSRIRAAIEAAQERSPGLFFGGNYYNGVSLGDSIVNGFKLAQKAEEFLDSRVVHNYMAA